MITKHSTAGEASGGNENINFATSSNPKYIIKTIFYQTSGIIRFKYSE
jgi:hypothetical protein